MLYHSQFISLTFQIQNIGKFYVSIVIIIITKFMGSTQINKQPNEADILQGFALLWSENQQYDPCFLFDGYDFQDDTFERESIGSIHIQANPFFLKPCQLQKIDSNRPLMITNPPKKKWLQVFYHESLFQKILDFLSIEQWNTLMCCSRRAQKEIIILKLHRINNWDFIFLFVQKHINSGYYDRFSINQQQSQHSLDLDRTISFFNPDSDRFDQQARLDRVLTALSFTIGYFQGLNSITAILLHIYDEQQTYWIVRYLLYKCNNIQNDNSKLYASYMQNLEELIEKNLPRIYRHLQQSGFSIDYFAMRWILALFSYDLQNAILMKLWDNICVVGIDFLTYFILYLLQAVEEQALKLQGDQLNNWLKIDFKQNSKKLNFQTIFRKSKDRYIQMLIKPKVDLVLESTHEFFEL